MGIPARAKWRSRPFSFTVLSGHGGTGARDRNAGAQARRMDFRRAARHSPRYTGRFCRFMRTVLSARLQANSWSSMPLTLFR